LSRSETGMVSCLIRPKAAFFCWQKYLCEIGKTP
jgi:hypothetical protein